MISLKPVGIEEKELLWNIRQKNLYEMTTYYPDDMDENGNYRYGDFDSYFTGEGHTPYLIYCGDALAGYAMMNSCSYIGRHPDRVLAEFAVFPFYRKRHIGTMAAQAILALHPGRWEIKYHRRNEGAGRLWESVTKPYGPTVHHLNEDETVLEFSNG